MDRLLNSNSPIDHFIEHQGVVILDGGLATELEHRGYDLDHPLWSARILIDNPKAIYGVHRAYLEAGSDCIVSATYQASLPGLISHGLSKQSAGNLIKETITIARNALDDFLGKSDEKDIQPLIAASIGPYGAYLANGAEYHGKYDINNEELMSFHRSRWELLAQTSADIFACETIPSMDEAVVLRKLTESTPDIPVWMSFSCKDENEISDGTPIEECVSLFEDIPQVVAIGINCTAPKYIKPLINKITGCATSKHIVVYPNSGEEYDPVTKKWIGSHHAENYAKSALQWHKAGARLIGGCCRTGPEHIVAIRKALTAIRL